MLFFIVSSLSDESCSIVTVPLLNTTETFATPSNADTATVTAFTQFPQDIPPTDSTVVIFTGARIVVVVTVVVVIGGAAVVTVVTVVVSVVVALVTVVATVVAVVVIVVAGVVVVTSADEVTSPSLSLSPTQAQSISIRENISKTQFFIIKSP